MKQLKWALAAFLSAATLGAGPASRPSDRDIDMLILQLGDPSPAVRESATAKLKTIGKPALDALKEAQNSVDPETKARASLLLQRIQSSIPGGPIDMSRPPALTTLSIGPQGQTTDFVIDGRRIRITRGPAGGLEVSVTGQEDGKEITRTFQAKDDDDLEQQNAELAGIVKRWDNQAANMIIRGGPGGIQIQGVVVNRPNPLLDLRQKLEVAMAQAHLPEEKRAAIRQEINNLNALELQPLGESDEQKDARLKKVFSTADALRDKIGGLKVDLGQALPPPSKARLGVQLRQAEIIGPGQVGLIVDTIVSGSRAEKLGLKEGDAITKVDDKPIQTITDLRDALSAAKGPITIQCLRDGDKVDLKEKAQK